MKGLSGGAGEEEKVGKARQRFFLKNPTLLSTDDSAWLRKIWGSTNTPASFGWKDGESRGTLILLPISRKIFDRAP